MGFFYGETIRLTPAEAKAKRARVKWRKAHPFKTKPGPKGPHKALPKPEETKYAKFLKKQ